MNPGYWISLNRLSRKTLKVVGFEVGQKKLIGFNEEELSWDKAEREEVRDREILMEHMIMSSET